MREGAWAVLLAAALTAACDNMISQPKPKTLAPSAFFPDGRSARVPPADTAARGEDDGPGPFPVRIDARALARGRERYAIYCSPCHGALGDGRGMIPRRGFPQPPSYHQDRLRAAPDSHFEEVMEKGYGVMYSYGDRVTPADRRAIIAYIRVLQYSRWAKAADLPASDRAELERLP